MEDVRALVLLGLPIPNPDAFKEEAWAFFDWDEPTFDWERREQFLELRGGLRAPVSVGGYWSEPVASYYRQKCQYGLYQAMHRIRPYTEREYERHIYVFTNMPIPNVKVDVTLGNREGRLGRAVIVLDALLVERGECTVTELADRLEPEATGRSIPEWVRTNAEKLARLTTSNFTAGVGRRPGHFARSTP